MVQGERGCSGYVSPLYLGACPQVSCWDYFSEAGYSEMSTGLSACSSVLDDIRCGLQWGHSGGTGHGRVTMEHRLWPSGPNLAGWVPQPRTGGRARHGSLLRAPGTRKHLEDCCRLMHRSPHSAKGLWSHTHLSCLLCWPTLRPGRWLCPPYTCSPALTERLLGSKLKTFRTFNLQKQP